MKITTQIRNFISGLDEKIFYQYLGVVIAFILLLTGAIGYVSLNTLNNKEEQIQEINSTRTKVQGLLTQYVKVKKERQRVNELIAKEKELRIGFYFQELLESLGLSNNLSDNEKREGLKPNEPVIQDKEFAEVSLSSTLSRLSMKQLVDLLQKIDKTERVYIKRLEINKARGTPPAINVTLTIATLNQREEAVE